MDAVVHFLQPLDLHPVVDHFTVALLITGVVLDLVASLFPLRPWMRYMALTLMILGAISAAASYFTGDMEYDRVAKFLSDPGKKVLDHHALLGEIAAIAFGVIALWRILVEAFGAFAGTRGFYLIVAFIGACFVGYVGHLGGMLVYTYGAGTALLAAEQNPTPKETPTPSVPMALPTVSVPTAMATPTPTAPSSASTATPVPSPKAPPSAVPSDV